MNIYIYNIFIFNISNILYIHQNGDISIKDIILIHFGFLQVAVGRQTFKTHIFPYKSHNE